MNGRLTEIRLDEIDAENDRFSCSFPPESSRLTEAIRAFGQITPIVVRPSGNRFRYQVISGMRRVRSLARLGKTTASAIQLDGREMGDLEFFLWNLVENAASRPLSHVERATAVKKLITDFRVPEAEVVEKYLPVLEENPSWTHLRQLGAVSDLSPETKKLISQKSLPLSTAAEFGLFPLADQPGLASLLEEFRFSAGKIKETLETLDDILKRENIALPRLLESGPFPGIVGDPSVPSAARAARFREELRKRRNPLRTELEDRIRRSIQKLNLSREIQLSVPSLFEGGRVHVEFETTGPDHMKKIAGQLDRLYDDPGWRELFKQI